MGFGAISILGGAARTGAGRGAAAPSWAEGYARRSAPVLVVRLRGAQADLGAQHGRILRGLGGFEPPLAYYPRMPMYLLRGTGGGGLAGALLEAAGTPLLEAALRRLERARPAPYRERTRAFLEALGWPAEHGRYFFVMDLFQNVVGLAGRYGLGAFGRKAALEAPPACSTLVAWGRASEGGVLRHARNFDFPGIGVWDRGPTVVLHTPEQGLRYGFVTTRGADVPGVTIFNEAGLTLTGHTRFHRDVVFDGAGVIDVAHDIGRRAETIADAVRIVRERPVASTWGLAISSEREGRAASIETCATEVGVVEPRPGEDFLPVANRFRHDALRRGEVTPSAAFAVHTESREACMRAAAEAGIARGGLTATDLQALLASHDDGEARGTERAAGGVITQPYTVQSVVCEPSLRRIHVSAGGCPTGRGPYVEIPWEWDGEPLREVAPPDAPPAASGRYVAGAGAAGYIHFVEACRLAGSGGSLEAVEGALRRAIDADPGDPSYRFLAGAIRLKALDARAALEHFERGLAAERSEFRRGQLLLFASRAAEAAGERERARAFRRELLATRHRWLAAHRESARAEEGRPLTARRLRAVTVSLPLVDARC